MKSTILLLLTVICIKQSSTYNKNLLIYNLFNDGCREVLLKDEDFKERHLIDDLLFNNPKEDEVLRLKMYMLGFDAYIELTTADKALYWDGRDKILHSVISGWGRTRSYASMHDTPSLRSVEVPAYEMQSPAEGPQIQMDVVTAVSSERAEKEGK